MKRIVLLAGLLSLVTGASLFFSDVRLKEYSLERQGNDIVLRWEAEVEVDVDLYVVQRSTSASRGLFVDVRKISAQGAGRPYEFHDDQLYKDNSEMVSYRIVAVFKDGASYVFADKSIDYTSTAVRRTWGSIKAMFQ